MKQKIKDIFLFIRNYFNFEQKRLLEAQGRAKIIEIAELKSWEFNKIESEHEKRINDICPNCRGKKIVNKIARVEGSGNLNWGSGKIQIDTKDIRHCNDCGNQWKKYETNYYSPDDIIATFCNQLTAYIKDNNDASDTINLLKDIPAESIWEEFKRVERRCYQSTQYHLTLHALRKIFPSVY